MNTMVCQKIDYLPFLASCTLVKGGNAKYTLKHDCIQYIVLI